MFEAYADEAARDVQSLSSDLQMTRFGVGALHEIGDVAQRLGITRALVIADPHLVHQEAFHVLQSHLEGAGIACVVSDQVTPTPLYSDVHTAVEAAEGCDGVVSFGGGSASDIGKVAALLGKNGGSIHAYAHEEADADSTWPHIAVPTTAGTGAESSSYAFLLEEHGHEHTILHHPILMPAAAVVDPLVHVTMSPRLTATTGMNALSHAVEAYVSRAHTDASDEAALEAIRLVHDHLPKAVADGGDLDARTGMARASYQAGRAFNLAGLGIVDSISLVLSSLFNIGHSAANAIVLPHLLAYDAYAVEDRLRDVAKALGRDPAGMDRREVAEAAIEAVAELKERIGVTQTLADRGISWDDLYLCSHAILRHPFIARNPRPLDERGLQEILLDSMESHRVTIDEPPKKVA